MYLRKIHIKRMKRIRDLVLQFPLQDGRPRPWTVIIGENGTAKTSILQAIGLAAAGQSQGNSLLERGVDLLRDRRTLEEPMEISADFEFTARSSEQALHPRYQGSATTTKALNSRLVLHAGSTTFFGDSGYLGPTGARVDGLSDPLNHARAFHTAGWFVAAYGVARVLPDPSQTPDLAKRSVERLKPLFDHRSQLASVGMANYMKKLDAEGSASTGQRARQFAKILNTIIKKGGAQLMPGILGLELRGQGGARSARDLIDADRFKVKFGPNESTVSGLMLSHGFQSTFAWIADLVGHVLLDQPNLAGPEHMEGLVLIDEIDLYLHPHWQSTFISALRRVFPRIQFIATTHSPVVLSGLRPEEIVRLKVDDAGDVRQFERDPHSGELVPIEDIGAQVIQSDPRSMSGTEIYEDYFGIGRLTLHPAGEDYRTYLSLATDPYRDQTSDRKLRDLRAKLKSAGIDPLPEPVAIEAPE